MKLINKNTETVIAEFRNEREAETFLRANPETFTICLQYPKTVEYAELVYSGGLVLSPSEFLKAAFIQASPAL